LAELFCDEVLDTSDVITFEGETLCETKEAFKESVDHHLQFCAPRGRQRAPTA
jgi:predicted HicB family RNase H-like nuclease